MEKLRKAIRVKNSPFLSFTPPTPPLPFFLYTKQRNKKYNEKMLYTSTVAGGAAAACV